MKKGSDPFRIHVQQWQQKMRPGQGGNFLTRLLSYFVFAAVLILGLVVGVFVLLIGWLLMLPLLWRKRKAVKQAWQFSQAAKQQAREHQRRQQHGAQPDDSFQDSNAKGRSETQRPGRNTGTTIEGEYEVKDDK